MVKGLKGLGFRVRGDPGFRVSRLSGLGFRWWWCLGLGGGGGGGGGDGGGHGFS